jgi:zinc/manganese transport system permease protein
MLPQDCPYRASAYAWQCVLRLAKLITIDVEVAQARGIPVRSLAIVFLMLVAVVVSISVQVAGVLLIERARETPRLSSGG